MKPEGCNSFNMLAALATQEGERWGALAAPALQPPVGEIGEQGVQSGVHGAQITGSAKGGQEIVHRTRWEIAA